MDSLLNLEEIEQEVVNSEVETNDFMINQEAVNEETAKQEAIRLKEREEYFMDPNVQAQVLYENYINHTNRIMDGTEKRRLRREFLRNAKKGKYNKMFYNELHGIVPKSKEKSFKDLNG